MVVICNVFYPWTMMIKSLYKRNTKFKMLKTTDNIRNRLNYQHTYYTYTEMKIKKH